MRKTKKALAILALVAMVLTMIPMQLFAADDRLSGNDRYETAIAIAEAGWANGADTVILAAGDNDNLVDALAAASLAGQENAPILLTPKASLNAKVSAAIKDLGAKKVYIIGAAQGLESAVKALGVDVKVLAGESRWATADAINAELKDVKGTFVVAYNGLADALSVASYAAANGFQIVLADAQGAVASSKLVGDVYTVGGAVKSISGEKDRFAGADRFATNEAVVKGLGFKFDAVYVANGLTLADALAGAPLAAKAGAPILLASASDVKAASYVNEKLTKDSKVVALGGTSSVSNVVLTKVAYQAPPAPAKFAVESVSAINLKQFDIKFNQELDKDSAQTASYYQVYDNGSSSALGGVFVPRLLDDKQTVRLTLVNDASTVLTNFSKAKVVISKDVLAKDGTKLGEDYTASDVVVSDTTAPTIVSVTQSAPNKLKVKFSEAVKDISGGLTIGTDNFRLDNGAYIVSGATNDLNSHTIELTIGGDVANGEHTLTVNPTSASDLADFAGFKVALKTEFKFTVSGDNEAPYATVTEASQTGVTFRFNEKVSNANSSNVAYRHSVNNTTYEVLGNSAHVTIDDSNSKYTEVTVNFAAAGYPLPQGSSIPVYIAYKSTTSGYTAIVDNFNNKYVPATYYVSVTADTTAPTASVKMVPGSNTQFDVTYSEAVNGADVAANYTLKDSDKNTVALSGNPVKQTGNVYRLTAASPLSGTYTLEIKNIEDKAVVPNKMETTTLTFTVPDEIKPFLTQSDGVSTPAKVYTLKDAKNVRLYFSEAMNTSDLADATKYQNVADSYKHPTEVKVSSDGKYVDLTFANNVVNGQGIVVGQMRDLAGNKMATLATTVTTVEANPTIGLKPTNSTWKSSVIATSPTTIKVYLNTLISEFSAADFEIEKDGTGTWVAPASISVSTENNKSVLTLNLSEANKLDEALWGDGNPPAVRTVNAPGSAGAANGTKDASGVKIQFSATDSTDAIAPSLIDDDPIATLDVDGNGKIDHIKVSFKEKINQSYVSADKFTVDTFTVKDAYPSNVAPTSATNRTGATVGDAKDIYIRVEEKSALNGDAKPSVTIASGLQDLAGNLFEGVTKTAVDGVAPSLTSAVYFDSDSNGKIDKVVLTFKENIKASSVSASDFTFGATTDFGAISGVSVVNNVITITLTEGATVTTYTAATLAWSAGAFEDVNGTPVAARSAAAMTDGAAPILVSVNAAVAGGPVTLKFSENITSDALVLADFAGSKVDGVDITALTANSVTVAADTIVTNADLAPAGADGQELVIVISASGQAKIKDAANNTLNPAKATATDDDIVD